MTPVFMTGAIAVQLRADVGVGVAGLGAMIASGNATYALTSTVVVGMVRRIGPSQSLRVGALASGAVMACMATVGRTALVLGVLIGISGLVNSLVQAATNFLLAEGLPGGRLGLAFGLKQSAAPLATLLAGVLVPLLSLTLGWRSAFLAAAILSVPAALAVPKYSGAPGARREELGIGAALALWPLVVVTLGMTFAFAAANGTLTFLTTSAVHAGITSSAAGVLVAVGSVGGIAVRIGCGHLSDRGMRREVGLIVVLLTAGAGCFAALATGQRPLVAVATPLVLMTAWAFPGLLLVAAARANAAAPTMATSVIGIGAGAGSALGPPAFGMLVEGSYPMAFVLAGVACLTAIPFLVLGSRRMHRHRRPTDCSRDC